MSTPDGVSRVIRVMSLRPGLRWLLAALATISVVFVLQFRWCSHHAAGRESADVEWREGDLVWAPNPTGGFPVYRLMRSADLDPMSWYGGVADAEVQHDREAGYRARVAELEAACSRPELPAGWLPPRMEELWRAMSRTHAGTDAADLGDWRIQGVYSTYARIGVRRSGLVNRDRIRTTWRGERPVKVPGDTFSWLPGPDAESICIGTWNERTLAAVYILRPGLIAHAWIRCWRRECEFRGDLRAHRTHRCPMREPRQHGRDGGIHDALSRGESPSIP